jgi:hypothetical protein
LLVSIFLLSILMTSAYTVYVLSMRYMMVSQIALDLQAQAQKAVATMLNDLADTDTATIVTGTSGSSVGIIFCSPRDAQDNIEQGPVWQAWVGYYTQQVTANGPYELFRKWIPITPTSTLPANNYSLATFMAASGGATRLISGGMSTINPVNISDTSLAFGGSVTGATVTSGSNVITGISAAQIALIQPGQVIKDTGSALPAGTQVVTAGTSSYTISQNATASASNDTITANNNTPVVIMATFTTSLFNTNDFQVTVSDSVWPRN